MQKLPPPLTLLGVLFWIPCKLLKKFAHAPMSFPRFLVKYDIQLGLKSTNEAQVATSYIAGEHRKAEARKRVDDFYRKMCCFTLFVAVLPLFVVFISM